MAERNVAVDLLRGSSMLVVVFLHSIVSYLEDPFWAFTWDYLHFAVAGFVFCSAVILFDRYLRMKPSELFSLPVLWKRLRRLYFPYGVFVVVFLGVQWWYEPDQVTLLALWQNLTLTGGIDINWLVLLFLQFVLLFPAIAWLYQQMRIGFWIYTAAAVGIAAWLYLVESPDSWKWMMWIPWSLVGVYAVGYLRSKLVQNQKVMLPFLGIVTGVLLMVQPIVDKSVSIYDNKYPPDLLFILYGCTAIAVLKGLFSMQMVQKQPWLRKPLAFLSLYSYPIYFIHYLVLYVADQYTLSSSVHPMVFFIGVLGMTVFLMWGITKMRLS